MCNDFFKKTLLSEREKNVYNLIIKGFSIKEIAKIMMIGETTARTHTANIMRKKVVNSRLELLAQRILELENEINNIKRKANKMRKEEEIREQLLKLKELNCKEKTKMGKIIYGLGISIIRWVLGEIDEL